ncbi:signal peptidase I [Clostridia bacterium OttesenSCG-928-F22]|nr:signal peptidase I [Clostridia bacterium OttesenSCG-928-F22]
MNPIDENKPSETVETPRILGKLYPRKRKKKQAEGQANVQEASSPGDEKAEASEPVLTGVGSDKKEKRKSPIRGYIITLLIAVTVGLLLRTFVISFMHVEGPSMEPTLYSRHSVLVEKIIYKFGMPSRNDIVVCKYNETSKELIKRVIGLPGETLEIRDDKLYIDGEEVAQPYLDESVFPLDNFGPVTVEEGHIFVMGDNRPVSMDSRSPVVGQIRLEYVIGCARLKVWPLNEFGSLE